MLLLGLVFIICALLRMWLLSPKVEEVIDSNRVYWIPKNRKILWDQKHGVTCEMEDNNYFNKVSQQVFLCFLNDGWQLKFMITGGNYSADTLYQKITEQFPNIRCTFVENRS